MTPLQAFSLGFCVACSLFAAWCTATAGKGVK